MENNKQVTFTRDCQAILIPYGESVTLQKGDEATITQALGGSYTLFIRGSLVRIDGKDADAIGMESIPDSTIGEKITALSTTQDGDNTQKVTSKLVWDALRTCYDPEIPINIVDLGLIYSCELKPQTNGSTNIEIKMTLTAPGCGLGELIADDARQKISHIPGVGEVTVELVWDPPWDRSMMTEAAQLKLGMM